MKKAADAEAQIALPRAIQKKNFIISNVEWLEVLLMFVCFCVTLVICVSSQSISGLADVPFGCVKYPIEIRIHYYNKLITSFYVCNVLDNFEIN